MSEEFGLRENPVEFGVEIETGTAEEDYNADADVREALSSVPGVVINSAEEEDNGLRVEVWSDEVPEKSDLRKFILQRINDSSLRKGGPRDRTVGLNIERLEEGVGSGAEGSSYEEAESEDFWNQIRRESRKLELEDFSEFEKASELGYENLVNFNRDHKGIESAADYILDRSIYPWKDIWAALGRDIVRPRPPFDARDRGTLYEIKQAKDGTEYQEVWEEILLDYLNDEYGEEVETVLESRAEEFDTIKEVREQTQDYLSSLDITMPVGYTDKGEISELVLPIPQQRWNPLEVLLDEIKSNLGMHQKEEISRNDKMAIINVDATKDEVYQSLRQASQKLNSNIDYGFLLNNYNQE